MTANEVVTIWGSMRFENEMKRIAFILEAKHNMTVLQCVYNEDKLDILANRSRRRLRLLKSLVNAKNQMAYEMYKNYGFTEKSINMELKFM